MFPNPKDNRNMRSRAAQQIQRRRASQPISRVQRRVPTNVVLNPITQAERRQFADLVAEVNTLAGLARRAMFANNVMRLGLTPYTYGEMENVINGIMIHFPYVFHEIDDNLSHLYNTNNGNELRRAIQTQQTRVRQLNDAIGSNLNQIIEFVQTRGSDYYGS